VRDPLFVVAQNIILGSCVQRRKGIDSPQYVIELFSHDAPAAPLRKALETLFEGVLNRFVDGFSRLLGDLPRQTFGNRVFYAEGHFVLCSYLSILL